MKYPQFLLALTALSASLILAACGGGSNAQIIQNPPPPPPTGTNYTTCNNQQVPNWQSAAFQTPYKAAISAVVAHYRSNSNIGYFRIGLGRGGEINLPQGWNESSSGSCYGGYTSTWGYTVGGSTPSSSTWNTYLSGMVSFESALTSQSHPLLVSITPVTGTSPNTVTDDFIAPIAVQNGLSYGNQGLEASDIMNYPNCGGDWCHLFQVHPPNIAELQTLGQSCPTGTTCVNSLASNTGPLDPLLPFATSHGASNLEIYYQDWLIAYDSTYAASVGASSSSAAYKTAIQNAKATGATMQVLFPPQTSDTDFQAVHDFLMSNPDVSGTVISVDWSDIEPTSSGSFDWTITDAAIQPWIQAGKTVNLVFQNTTYGGGSCPAQGIGSNGNVGTNCAMPAWMWTALNQ
jgi:hypothetical protein